MKTKVCSKCGEKLSATTDYFYSDKRNKDGLYSACKKCHWQRARQWCENNYEYKYEYMKKWYNDNREYHLIYNKQWHETNPDYNRQWCKANPEKCLETRRRWCVNNPEAREKQHECSRRWSKRNRSKRNASSAKRRALKKGQTPEDVKQNIIALYYTICVYLNKNEKKTVWHIDHIQPISKGGLHHEDNLQILLAKLNLEKGDKWPLSDEEKIQFKGIIYTDSKFLRIIETMKEDYNG
jgi:hypothetical protein